MRTAGEREREKQEAAETIGANAGRSTKVNQIIIRAAAELTSVNLMNRFINSEFVAGARVCVRDSTD